MFVLKHGNLYRLLLVIGTGLLASCGGDGSSDNTLSSDTAVEADTKSVIETYSAGQRHVEDVENYVNDIAVLAKASRDLASATLSLQSDNFVVSPYEWEHTLAMLAAGTGTGGGKGSLTFQDGKTFEFTYSNTLADIKGEMFVFQVESSRLHAAMNGWDQKLSGLNGSVEWHRSSGVWGQTNYLFLTSYLDTLAQFYGADTAGLSFAFDKDTSSQAIADWIDVKVNGDVEGVLTANDNYVNALTRVIHVNLDTLSVNWGGLFEATQTTNERFEMLDGTKKLVPTMHASGMFNFVENNQYQAFELPFQNSTLALLIIMPKAEQFNIVKSQLSETPFFENIVTSLEPTYVSVHVPRFAAVSKTEPESSPLYGWAADFSEVNGQGYLHLTQLAQAATIAVSELGVHANAGGKATLDATRDEPSSVWAPGNNQGGQPGGGGSYSVIVSGDFSHPCYSPTLLRPFIFAIRETTTSSLLYAGMWLTPPGPEMEPDWIAMGGQTCEEALNPPTISE